MTKTEYAEYLQSNHWQELRRRAITESGPSCNRCAMPRWLAQIAYDQDLHVHHKSYRRKGCEELEDLEVLCRRCHDIETFGRSEFKEPKVVTCECCGSPHWNPYSDYCQLCLGLIVGGGDCAVIAGGTFLHCSSCGGRFLGRSSCPKCPGGGEVNQCGPIWERVLMRIAAHVGQGAIIDLLAFVEEMDKHVLYNEVESDGEIG